MKGDMRQVVILAVSFLIGVAAFVLTHVYLKGELARVERQRQEIEAGIQKVKVLVAGRSLPAGTVIGLADVAQKSVPRSGLSSEPVLPDEFDRVDGRKLLFSIDKEAPILWAFVDSPYKPGAGLAPTIKKRMRAISISVGGSAAVSGLVQPNDRVDVLGTFSLPAPTGQGEMETVTMTILQNVTVLATGTQLGNAGSGETMRTKSQGYGAVTVEVSPEEAELLVFSEYMKGRLTLSLRNPSDIDYLKAENLQSVNFGHLQKKIPEYNEKRQQSIVTRK